MTARLPDIRTRTWNQMLAYHDAYQVRWENHSTPVKVQPGSTHNVAMSFANAGTLTWDAGGSNPVRVGELQMVEVGEKQLPAYLLHSQGYRCCMSEGEPDDTDPEPPEHLLLIERYFVAVAARAQEPELLLGQEMDEPSRPGVIDPDTVGFKWHFADMI